MVSKLKKLRILEGLSMNFDVLIKEKSIMSTNS